MIAETSYCYTSEDGDGCANSVTGTDGLVEGYPATVQGQASMIRDICAAANEHPLSSLNVFQYLKYGSTAPLAIDHIPGVYASCDVGIQEKAGEHIRFSLNLGTKIYLIPCPV